MIKLETVLSVLVALLVFRVLDKMFLSNIPMLSSFEAEDNLDDDFDNFDDFKKKRRSLKKSKVSEGNFKKIKMLSGLENFDDLDENFDDLDEDFDDFTDVENFYEDSLDDFLRRGNNRNVASQKASSRTRQKFGSSRWAGYVANKKSHTLTGGKGLKGTRAQFTVKITRLNLGASTVTHTSILPCTLFGSVHRSTDYPIQAQKIPTGSVLASTYQSQGSFVFVYQNNVNPSSQSLIIVQCQQTGYTSLLDTLITDSFRSAFVRMEVNKTLDLDQFNNDMFVSKKTSFGLTGENPISVQNNRNPKNYQDGIIDIPTPFDIDKDTGLIVLVKPNPQPFTLSFNVAKFYRQDRRTLG